MPRAKPRLTRKKKSKARQAAPVDPELAALPTDAEWESLTKKKYFDGESHRVPSRRVASPPRIPSLLTTRRADPRPVGSPPFRLRVGTE